MHLFLTPPFLSRMEAVVVFFTLSQMGCPRVLAGASEDKPQVAALAGWAGIGVDLKTDKPTDSQIRKVWRKC